MGSQCRALPVTLRIGYLDEGDNSLDHEATWLLGHTEFVDFGRLHDLDGSLVVEATLHVPCRFLKETGARAACLAHGFHGRSPARVERAPQPRQLGGGRFRLVDHRHLRARDTVNPRFGLPVLADNPCVGAPCRTADNTRGAACCRDLEVEILCSREQTRLEALVRSRKSPYLCKVARTEEDSLDVELISACGYLGANGVDCTLHGRRRADGRAAKPDLCSDWPPKGKGLHPGCVFGKPLRASPCQVSPGRGGVILRVGRSAPSRA